MKFTYVGHANFAWAELLKEFPPEHLTALNKKRINVQSLAGIIKLLTAMDLDEEITADCETPPYILEMFSLSFWFELPFTLVEELFTKTRIRGINIQQARTDENKGLLVGTLGAWIELCNFRGKPFVSTHLSNLAGLVIGILERENLSTLLQ